MAKAVLTLGGYLNFVMDVKQAAQVMEILGASEVYESKWRKEEEGGVTKHVYPLDMDKASMVLMNDDMYRMAKLAGKPE